MPDEMDSLTRAAAQYVRQRLLSVSKGLPRVFELEALKGDGLVVNTVAGAVSFEDEINALEDPPEKIFFVDLDPNANWEHECAYIVAHSSGRITEVSESSPPSSRTNAILKEIDFMSIS